MAAIWHLLTPTRHSRQPENRLSSVPGTRCIRYILLLVALCFSLPNNALSAKKEAKIGKEQYDAILAEMPIYTDPKLVDYVTKIGEKVARVSDRPNYKFTFTIIDSPDINAFATPGGYVYINRGLITYMTSEAQLAAVLAHEIGHVTAEHATRQNRAQTTNNVISGILGVLTGSGDVAEASSLWGQSVVNGYGREMELEADQLGAQYLFNAGYPPNAMVEVISLLKDNERLGKRRALESGKKARSYHGLFASHPRNDKRLLSVIEQAGELSTNLSADENITPFRIATEGIPWGTNYREPPPRKDRFSDRQLKFRFDHPEGWQFESRDKKFTGSDPQQHYRMTIEALPRTNDTPRQYIKNKLGHKQVKKAEDFTQAKLNGSRGFVTAADGTSQQRIAVIYYGRYAYVFGGDILADGDKKQGDEYFAKIIDSFRPLSSRVIKIGKTKVIHYVKAKQNFTFRKLAQHLQLDQFGEQELRIINGYPARGEPKAGEWIKIIQ